MAALAALLGAATSGVLGLMLAILGSHAATAMLALSYLIPVGLTDALLGLLVVPLVRNLLRAQGIRRHARWPACRQCRCARLTRGPARTARRLSVLRLLIASLLLTLLARLSFVQLLDQHKPLQSAGLTHLGTIVVPAPRGEILDARGRVLVGNRSTHVLTVDRSALDQQDDGGAAVLARLAPVLGTTPPTCAARSPRAG